jgi:DNA-binding transcriptional LysR family regulator
MRTSRSNTNAVGLGCRRILSKHTAAACSRCNAPGRCPILTCHVAHPRSPPKKRRNGVDAAKSRGCDRLRPVGRVPGLVDAPLKRLRRKRRVAVTLPHFLAGPAIVARTDFVMTIPHRIARKYSELYSLRIFAPPLRVPGFEVAMAWPTRREADPAINWLRTQARMLY